MEQMLPLHRFHDVKRGCHLFNRYAISYACPGEYGVMVLVGVLRTQLVKQASVPIPRMRSAELENPASRKNMGGDTSGKLTTRNYRTMDEHLSES